MALDLIETISISATGTEDIDFTSIPGTYKTLLAVGSVRSDSTAVNNDALYLLMGNGSIDTGTNYDYFAHRRSTTGDAEHSASGAAASLFAPDGFPTGNDTDADEFGTFSAWFLGYAETNKFKNVLSDRAGSLREGSAAATQNQTYSSTTWKSTSAIDTIRFTWNNAGDEFAVGSVIHLFGMS